MTIVSTLNITTGTNGNLTLDAQNASGCEVTGMSITSTTPPISGATDLQMLSAGRPVSLGNPLPVGGTAHGSAVVTGVSSDSSYQLTVNIMLGSGNDKEVQVLTVTAEAQ